jgi:hypothetical protein
MRRLTVGGLLLVAILVAIGSVQAAVAREYARVTFREPVKVLGAMLMGEYVIEHDEIRMAAGGPCTAIYRPNDMTHPVLSFHCVHLTRPVPDVTRIVLTRQIGRPAEMTEFQFAGASASHGVPVR